MINLTLGVHSTMLLTGATKLKIAKKHLSDINMKDNRRTRSKELIVHLSNTGGGCVAKMVLLWGGDASSISLVTVPIAPNLNSSSQTSPHTSVVGRRYVAAGQNLV